MRFIQIPKPLKSPRGARLKPAKEGNRGEGGSQARILHLRAGRGRFLVKEPNSRRGVPEAHPTIRAGGGRFLVGGPCAKGGLNHLSNTLAQGVSPKRSQFRVAQEGPTSLSNEVRRRVLGIWLKTKSRAGGSRKVRPTLAQPPFAYFVT